MTTHSTNYLMQHYHQLNTVLNKDDIGISKQSHYNLPSNEFTYGQPLKRDKEGAQLVTSNWAFHDHTRDQLPDRNFKELNKKAIESGCINSKTQQKFRLDNDAKTNVLKGKAFIDYTLPEEDFRYGRANRPPTPINYVVGYLSLQIGNMYGLQSEIQLELTYQQRQQDRQRTGQTLLSVKSSKSHQLVRENTHKKLNSQDKFTKQMFKMQRFTSIKNKVIPYNQSDAAQKLYESLKDRKNLTFQK